MPPQELTDKHLVAEYREIMRLPNNLKTSLNRKTSTFSLSEIPSQYVLGKGHVKFFFDKFLFLKKRFESLVQEMHNRGFVTNYSDSGIFDVSKDYMGDYNPTRKAISLNRKRINERISGHG